MELRQIIEAVLFAADKPLTIAQLQSVFSETERPEKVEVRKAIDEISDEYRTRPIQLQEVASGFRFQIKKELSQWVSRLFVERPPKYSKALLETLAIIAYRQPVTRGGIEAIRGVAVSSNLIRTLLERQWIRLVGYKDVPGKPALYSTTKQFLDYFNLKSLGDLPSLMTLLEDQESIEVFSENEDAYLSQQPVNEAELSES